MLGHLFSSILVAKDEVGELVKSLMISQTFFAGKSIFLVIVNMIMVNNKSTTILNSNSTVPDGYLS